MKKATLAIIVFTLYSVSCRGKFTIINSSPFTFQISNPNEDNDLGTFSVLRPLTLHNAKIRLDSTRKIQIDYGSRLKLNLVVDFGEIRLEDVKHDSSISYKYDSQENTFAIHPTDPNIDKFSFIVSSDPQPYRLEYDGDPNSQRLLWFTCTVPVFHHIGQEETDAHLMIVNGDLTEFGRTTQWRTFKRATSGIPIPMAYGLGNHDYQNNVEDCGDTDPIETQLYEYLLDSSTLQAKGLSKSCSDLFPPVPPTFTASCRPALQKIKGKIEDAANKYVSELSPSHSQNICARRMIRRMQNHIQRLGKVMWDFSSDEDSLAYAWNYGSILRFVQLHNHPGYTVKLKDSSAETYIIKPSYDWLIADMNAHKDRSYIVNVHDVVDNTNLEVLRPYFRRIKAIFAGHTHEAGVKCMNKIAIFDSGALFKNEFLRVDFSEGGRCFDVLHFVEDKYVSPLAKHYCFQSVLQNPC